MAEIAFAAPILPGKLETWRRFNEELKGSRKSQHAESRRRLGIRNERAWLQQTPHGDFAVVYLEGDNPAQMMQGIAQSNDPFDQWFKQQVQEIHGLDMSQPMPANELTFEFST